MSFREERDVFAFASESELKTSPLDRLGDLEVILTIPVQATDVKAVSLFEDASVSGSVDIEMMLKA